MNNWWYPHDVPLVLASRSPRRKAILESADIPLIISPADIDETGFKGTANETVVHWAIQKAQCIARTYPTHPVLGADTLVAYRNELLGKPHSRECAFAMLQRLSGNWHAVYGGVCLMWSEKNIEFTFVEKTKVKFRKLSTEEIEAYIATGEPMDKAGGYGIQGYGSMLIERVEGCYFNVMGLPISRFISHLIGDTIA